MEDKAIEIKESEMDFDSLNEEQEVTLSEEDITFTGDIKVVASSNPYVLGRLVGTFMVINEDNGNGRLYPLETIRDRVMNLPYTKRMMENKSLLGEAHHPMERTNIWMDESCISTTKLDISPDGSRLIGEADILDTPKGRIVNTLARYGTNIGISARATGKGTKRNGHLVITPDKYFFKTFDAVLNPGFETARPAKQEPDGSPMKVYEESEGLPTLYEEIKSQIESGKCDAKTLDYYINYSGDESLKELKLLFEDNSTVEVLENKGDEDMTEIENLKNQVEQLTEEKSKLEIKVQNLTSDLENLREEKIDVSDRLHYVNEESTRIQYDADTQIDELLDVIYQQKNELLALTEELKDLRYRYAGISSQLICANEEQKEADYNNTLLESEIEDLNKQLTEERNKPTVEVAPLQEEVTESELDEVKPRERVVPDKVELFEESVDAKVDVNEEVKEKITRAPVDRQVSLIKALGGK